MQSSQAEYKPWLVSIYRDTKSDDEAIVMVYPSWTSRIKHSSLVFDRLHKSVEVLIEIGVIDKLDVLWTD